MSAMRTAIILSFCVSACGFAQAPASDALDALKGLRSVTEVGLSYRDYAPRVLDAKVKVGQCSRTGSWRQVPSIPIIGRAEGHKNGGQCLLSAFHRNRGCQGSL
jgi:hypothetical protein